MKQRLFVAIDVPAMVRQQLAGLRVEMAGARWVKPEQMHLTLRFIGDVEDSTGQDIITALNRVRATCFSWGLVGVGRFPPNGRPRVLWAGLAANERLAQLYTAVEQALIGAGVPRDGRGFAPHITLARLNNPPADRIKRFLADHAAFSARPISSSEFHLYSSTLHSTGAVHIKVATFALHTLEARDQGTGTASGE